MYPWIVPTTLPCTSGVMLIVSWLVTLHYVPDYFACNQSIYRDYSTKWCRSRVYTIHAERLLYCKVCRGRVQSICSDYCTANCCTTRCVEVVHNPCTEVAVLKGVEVAFLLHFDNGSVGVRVETDRCLCPFPDKHSGARRCL